MRARGVRSAGPSARLGFVMTLLTLGMANSNVPVTEQVYWK
jgi:hypothetical protein